MRSTLVELELGDPPPARERDKPSAAADLSQSLDQVFIR
jgi:hypothetical protein